MRPAAAEDAEAIRAIRNDVIEHSTAMWTTRLLTAEDGQAWLEENLARRSAYVVEASGVVIGFANWAPWRPKDGYRHTVEDSVYLTEGHQGRGLGAELLRTLIAGAGDSGAHVMMASIEASNTRSVTLHERAGFELVGVEREVGRKHRQWLDVVELQRLLLNLARQRTVGKHRGAEEIKRIGRLHLGHENVLEEGLLRRDRNAEGALAVRTRHKIHARQHGIANLRTQGFARRLQIALRGGERREREREKKDVDCAHRAH